MVTAGTHEVGPANGSLHLRTTREGVAAKVGHDLLLKLARWSGFVEIPDSGDAADARIVVTMELDSLEVVEGTGGASPLDDGDRADILKNALKTLDVENHPTAIFTATAVRPGPGGGEIDGMLELAGDSNLLTLTVSETGASGWRAEGTVIQSHYGIKPYKAFFGALRLADPVRVECEASVTPG